MFDLDQAISEWRPQMAAGGIKMPDALDELESHLREEVDQQVRSGSSEQQAFDTAVQQLGEGEALKQEYRKVKRQRTSMNPLWKIRALALALIALYGLGALWAVVALLSTGMSLPLFKAMASSLSFVAGGIGLLKRKRWGWWLTMGLCAMIIITSLRRIFTTLTLESAMKHHDTVPYVVAGFYLAIAFLLTRDSVRKALREAHG